MELYTVVINMMQLAVILKIEKYEVIEKEYDGIDVTENLKESFKNIKDGETYPIEGLWDELSD